MDNNQNHYNFEIQEPQDNSSTVSREYRRIRKMIIRIAAICCVLSLIIGGGLGVLITNANKNTAKVGTAQGETHIEDSGSKLSPNNNAEHSATHTDTLLYTTGGSNDELSVEGIVRETENSIVAIVINYKATTTFGFQTVYYDAEASGSGVIISKDGYIATNNHVISGAETITVTTADGTVYDAKLIASDDNTDLALIKIEADNLQAAEIGDSTTLIKGQTVVAIGNPLGYLDGSVSSGIVSGLNRTLTFQDGTTLYHLIQTDASVNPGNSGGGLFNTHGQLIGIVTAKASSDNVEGLGFAIPEEDFSDIINDLYNYGYVKGRPALGINPVVITSSMEAMYYGLPRTGVYVQNFVSNDVESNSELHIGDCIVSIEGVAIATIADVHAALNNHKVGDEVNIEVYRDNALITVKTTLIEQNENY